MSTKINFINKTWVGPSCIKLKDMDIGQLFSMPDFPLLLKISNNINDTITTVNIETGISRVMTGDVYIETSKLITKMNVELYYEKA